MYRIRTLNNIARKGLERLPAAQFELLEEAAPEAAPDAILLRSHQLGEDGLHDGLLAIGRAGAGVNNIPVQACSERGVVVFNTPGANANAVKELVLAALLLSGRDVLGGLRFVAELDPGLPQDELNRRVEAAKTRFGGHELQGRTLGVLGLGAVGSLVAGAALDLGMRVLGYDPGLAPEAAARLHPAVERLPSMQAVLAGSDAVSLHVPAMESTRRLLNSATLADCRRGLALINFAREELVQAEDLLAALKSGRVRCYLSDFPCGLLLRQPGVVAMPHLGASTGEAEENCAVMVAEQLKNFLLNGNIVNSVNFPTTVLERREGSRLAFSNRNVPRVLGRVLSVLAEGNINVIDMLNKSRDEVAYNLIDMETPPDAGRLATIRELDGVIRARIIQAPEAR